MKLQKIHALVFTVIITLSCSDSKNAQKQTYLKLWYNQPANASVSYISDGWKQDK